MLVCKIQYVLIHSSSASFFGPRCPSLAKGRSSVVFGVYGSPRRSGPPQHFPDFDLRAKVLCCSTLYYLILDTILFQFEKTYDSIMTFNMTFAITFAKTFVRTLANDFRETVANTFVETRLPPTKGLCEGVWKGIDGGLCEGSIERHDEGPGRIKYNIIHSVIYWNIVYYI